MRPMHSIQNENDHAGDSADPAKIQKTPHKPVTAPIIRQGNRTLTKLALHLLQLLLQNLPRGNDLALRRSPRTQPTAQRT